MLGDQREVVWWMINQKGQLIPDVSLVLFMLQSGVFLRGLRSVSLLVPHSREN